MVGSGRAVPVPEVCEEEWMESREKTMMLLIVFMISIVLIPLGTALILSPLTVQLEVWLKLTLIAIGILLMIVGVSLNIYFNAGVNNLK
jgi:uncharacterized protein (DUF983 family)